MLRIPDPARAVVAYETCPLSSPAWDGLSPFRDGAHPGIVPLVTLVTIVSFGTADGLAWVPRQAICYANADLVSDAFRAVNGLRHS